MRIAITGHRGLPAATERLVDQAIREQLAACTGQDITGAQLGDYSVRGGVGL